MDLLRWTAVLLNVLMFAIGVYFEIHPQDRHDVWSAGAVAGAAVLNSAMLTVRGSAGGRHVLRRLRRITLIVNGLLLGTALLIAVLETLVDPSHAVGLGAALVLPPLVTIAALRRAGGA
jgi:hypothetical protein